MPTPEQPPVFPFLSTAAEVDDAVARTFGPRKPPVPMDVIGAAWKGIVASAARPPVKIIYDTDIGTDVDDAIALAFGLLRPELDFRAIITSRSEVRRRAAIVSRMLQIMGRTEIPFAAGSPLMFNGAVMRDKEVNQYPFAGPENDRPAPATEDAQELLHKVIKENWGEIWLVVVGTMVNPAILIRDHPKIAAGLKGIVCMGGEPTRPFAETNIKHDPEAAALVCRSGLLKFVGTYDVTVRMLFPKPSVDRLAAAKNPAAKAVLDLIRIWKGHHAHKPGPVVFDMCPLVWLFAPEMFSTAAMGLSVEVAPPERRAIMTPASDAPPCEVTTDANTVAIHRLLMDTLTRPVS
jgi:purine nucleosidase